jgi:hypothetical protein
MQSPRALRACFASRLLAILGTAALATTLEACADDGGGGAQPAGEGGAGGGGATGAGGGGGGGVVVVGPPYQPGSTSQCFAWPEDLACPTSFETIIYEFYLNGCPSTGWGVVAVDSAPGREVAVVPVAAPADWFVQYECCYDARIALCPQGGGRPYLVEGRPRTAEARAEAADLRTGGARAGEGAGWIDAPAPSLGGLDGAQRRRLAEAWAADGLLEHASVASFARFALSLLALGAPADLVALAHEAALDEIRHARLCFGLASAYAGRPIAPGPFPLGGHADVSTSLPALAASAALEGCIGETVAAVQALEQLAGATDPAVRAVLARIAADEARHAELAWRTVAWALAAGGAEVRAAVETAFASALGGRAAPEAGGASPDPTLRAHGRLDTSTTAAVVQSALREVVAPCAASFSA